MKVLSETVGSSFLPPRTSWSAETFSLPGGRHCTTKDRRCATEGSSFSEGTVFFGGEGRERRHLEPWKKHCMVGFVLFSKNGRSHYLPSAWLWAKWAFRMAPFSRSDIANQQLVGWWFAPASYVLDFFKFIFLLCSMGITIPKTNIAPEKIHGWKMKFPFEMALFSGAHC